MLAQIERDSLIGKVLKKLINLSLPYLKGYDILPVGFGRTRPIHFQKEYFYFQHGSEDELNKYFQALGR